MSTVGIDWGLGKSNVDVATGIRYGVISQHSINQDAINDFEMNYGEPHCPKCGNEVSATTNSHVDHEDWDNYSNHGCNDFVCETCQHLLEADVVYSDEPQGFTYDADGYTLTDCLDNDIFVLASPFYTFAQYCSPCVPGAGNLDTPLTDGVKTYCLGHDWFDGGSAPYPVYKVEDNTEVG
jgi:hypothetical protein